MSPTFRVVYQLLEWAAAKTGLTYEETNVVVFYILIPAAFFALIDRIIKRPICLLTFSVVVLLVFARIEKPSLLADQMFNASVRFLLGFSRFGIGYDTASVLVCVVLPVLLLLFLSSLAFPNWFQQYLPTFARITKGIIRRTP